MATFVVFAPSDRIENEKSIASFDSFQDVIASRAVRVQESAAPVLSAVAKLGEEAGVARVRDAANVSLMEIGHSEMMSGDAGDGPDPFEAAAARKVNMLPAVGGLILQDAEAEEVARLRDAGFEVVENKRYYYVPPEPAAADGMAADAGAAPPAQAWHLGHCGALGMHAAGFEGQGSCIGILDTGIDPDHPEFAGKTIAFARFDKDGNVVGTAPVDTGDHGTHVSAIAAGHTVGVAKAADLAVAAVLTYRSNGRNSGFLAQILAGFNWLVGNPTAGAPPPPEVTVVNASLGGLGYRPYLYQPIRTARDDLGIPFVGAIGNAGRGGMNRHGSPGNYDISIGVGAGDINDLVANFSDWGTVARHGNLAKPDLCAPGVAIHSAIPGGGYAPKNGTSMAAPYVAGAIALILQQMPHLNGNVAALEQEVYNRIAPMNVAAGVRAGRGRLAL